MSAIEQHLPTAASHDVHAHILDLVPRGARVLDLGCGNGALMAALQQQRDCTGYGVEIDDANVLACVQRGVQVIQLNLDEGPVSYTHLTLPTIYSV